MDEYLEIQELMNELYQYIIYYIPNIERYIDIIDLLSKTVIKEIANYYLENDVYPFLNDDYIEMDISDKIILLDNFFKDNNIPINIYDIVSNGVINIECRDFNDYSDSGRFKEGYNRYIDDKKTIDIYDHGILLDSVTWLHEITHYRNQRDKERSEEGKIFTESLSFIYELIYLDYLKELGYQVDDYYLDNLDGEAGMIKYTEPTFNLFNVYIKTGEVNKDNFHLIYNNTCRDDDDLYKEYYEPSDFSFQINSVLNNLDNYSNKDEFFRSSLVGFMYSLALPLQIYLYSKYEEDKSYLLKIEELNRVINSYSIEECFKLIGIELPISLDFLEELKNCTRKYMIKIGDYVKVLEYKKGKLNE